MKYLKSYNESLKNILKPKSYEQILSKLINLSPNIILQKSIEHNFLDGFKYLIDNNLVDETTKYLLEKYKFGLHQDVMKDYEKWFLEQLNNLDIYKSKNYKNTIIYKKRNNTIFNYDNEYYIFYYSENIYLLFESKFKFNYSLQKILINGMVEKYLKIKSNITVYSQNLCEN